MTSTHPDTPNEMILSEEQLIVSTRWEVSGRLRLTRRVVTQTRQIEVTVRREELYEQWEPARPGESDQLEAGEPQPAQTRDPLVIVLHEEVPEITLKVQPYEQATVSVTRRDSELPVTDTIRKENATVEQTAPRGEAARPPR